MNSAHNFFEAHAAKCYAPHCPRSSAPVQPIMSSTLHAYHLSQSIAER